LREVPFLDHIISATGIVADPRKLQDVLNWKAPTSVTEIRSFIGLVGYYWRSSPNFSKVAKPMTELLMNNNKFTWSPECETAFQPEEVIDNYTCLSYIRPGKTI